MEKEKKMTYSGLILSKLITGLRPDFEVREAHYTSKGVQALVFDPIDEKLYTLTINPKGE